MNIGELTRNSDGSVTGYIAEPTFDFGRVFLEKVESDNERAPAFNLMATSPLGRPVRIGSIWERAAQETGEIYYGGYVQSGASGYVPLRLFRSRRNPDVLNVVRKTSQRKATSALAQAEAANTGHDSDFSRELEDA